MANEPRQRETSSGFHFINLYQECPRKWFFRYVFGWIPNKTSKALLFGQAWHTALEQFYKGENIDKMIGSGLSALDESSAQYEKAEDLEEDRRRMPGMLTRWLSEISQRWSEYEVVAIEEQWSIPIADTEYWMTIRPDAIIQHKPTGTLWVVEHKTTGYSLIDAQMNVLRGDQATAYLWGLKHTVKKMGADVSIGGVLADVIYNKKSVIDFVQESVTRSDTDLVTFELSMFGLFSELERKYDDYAMHKMPIPVLFPRNSSACSKYRCEYENICRNVYAPGAVCPGGFHVDHLVGPHPILPEVPNGI